MRGTKSMFMDSNSYDLLHSVKVAFVQKESRSDIPVHSNTNYTGFVIEANIRTG